MSPKILIIIPAYNEEESLADTVMWLQLAGYNDILIIDDASTDNTPEVCKALEYNNKDLHTIHSPWNVGVSESESRGLYWALTNDFKLAVRVDADNQHDPASIKVLLNSIGDLVIGNRGESFSTSMPRRIASQILQEIIQYKTERRFTDPNSGFRLFRKDAIKFFAYNPRYNKSEPESLVYALQNGLRVTEKQVNFRPRKHGKSSFTPFKSAVFMAKVAYSLLTS